MRIHFFYKECYFYFGSRKIDPFTGFWLAKAVHKKPSASPIYGNPR